MKCFNQFLYEARTAKEQEFYNNFYSRALRQGASDSEAKVIAAQAALETGWGSSPSGVNNYFGQKASRGEQGTVKGTQEFGGGGMYGTSARFKDYGSVDDAIADRINKWGYKTRGATDVEDVARRLQLPGNAKIPGTRERSHGAYATDPDYVSKITSIASRYGGRSSVSASSRVASSASRIKGALDTPEPTRVLAKEKGKTGELDKTTGKFTKREWSGREGSRYKEYGGK